MSNTNTPRKNYKVTLEIDYKEINFGQPYNAKAHEVERVLLNILKNEHPYLFSAITRAECVVEGGEGEN